jgi:SNF2 family DNA or RNA helicase
VTVINLVTSSSIEDKILEKLAMKRKLFETILGTGGPERKSLSVRDLVDILKKK